MFEVGYDEYNCHAADQLLNQHEDETGDENMQMVSTTPSTSTQNLQDLCDHQLHQQLRDDLTQTFSRNFGTAILDVYKLLLLTNRLYIHLISYSFPYGDEMLGILPLIMY